MKIHSSSRGQHTSLSEINIIPMVDIMLVLLIIFMVAAPLMQQGVDVDLPETTAAAVSAAKDDMILTIDPEGKVYLGSNDKTPYSLTTIEEKLKAIFDNKEKKEIFLHADREVRYGYVVQVMAAAQRAGIERVGMVSIPEKEGK